jgi:LPXTG-motif cell wall-anchored protein
MRRFMLLAAMCAALTLAMAPAVMAQTDEFDCIDFEFQEDAQAVYNQDTSDPSGLDEDDGPDDGIACENLPSRGAQGTGTTQYAQTPTTVQGSGQQLMESSGNLPTTGGPSLLLPAVGALLLGIGGVALVVRRRVS